MNQKNIGKNIKKLRTKRGFTQSQLAEMADISNVHMSHIETGAVSMSLEILMNICFSLGSTPNEILLGEYSMSTQSVSTILDKHIDCMTTDEKRLLIEFADLICNMNINKK